MPFIKYENESFKCDTDESVLDCLLRNKQAVSFSCRSGVCQTCLMRAHSSSPPKKSQIGLKDTLQASGYFLSCICSPDEDMEVSLPGSDTVARIGARVHAKSMLNADILRLILRCDEKFDFKAGQFISLHRPDGLIRSYSIANCMNGDGVVELHIRKLPNGQMSGWVQDILEIGDTIELTGPSGSCFYIPNNLEGGILLIGTGSGLAPLNGIVRDALAQGHQGPILLYHGSWKPAGLYLVEELRQLSREHSNFEYNPCVDEDAEDFMKMGRADQIALCEVPNLKGWSVFLCGHPEMVRTARKSAFLSGASMASIYADPFVISKPVSDQ